MRGTPRHSPTDGDAVGGRELDVDAARVTPGLHADNAGLAGVGRAGIVRGGVRSPALESWRALARSVGRDGDRVVAGREVVRAVLAVVVGGGAAAALFLGALYFFAV